MTDIEIVKEFKRKILDIYPEGEIYFYGSRVDQSHRRDSDFDVLVLLDTVDPRSRDNVYDAAWEVGFKSNVLIAPVLIQKDDFYHSTASPFLNNIKQNGLAI
jgi:predicted nucleotidyltransferase